MSVIRKDTALCAVPSEDVFKLIIAVKEEEI